MEKTAYDVLEKIRRETEQNRQTTEAIYAAVQERRHAE